MILECMGKVESTIKKKLNDFSYKGFNLEQQQKEVPKWWLLTQGIITHAFMHGKDHQQKYFLLLKFFAGVENGAHFKKESTPFLSPHLKREQLAACQTEGVGVTTSIQQTPAALLQVRVISSVTGNFRNWRREDKGKRLASFLEVNRAVFRKNSAVFTTFSNLQYEKRLGVANERLLGIT